MGEGKDQTPKKRAAKEAATEADTREAAAQQAEAQHSAAAEGAPQEAEATGQALPLFYQNVRALESTRHARLGLSAQANLRFAAKTDSVPLTVAEFEMAARHYPIVFAQEAPHLPIAVVGLRRRENAFVDEAGRWAPDTYIPAYVRRYPFLLAEDRDADRVTLCIDEACEWLVEGGEPGLFDDEGQPSDTAKQAFDFCRAFHQQSKTTRSFVEALAGADLLVESKPQLPLPSGRTLTLQGFRSIDREKLDALGDSTFLELRKQGWLPAVYAQLLSQNNWPLVLRRSRAPESTSGTGGDSPTGQGESGEASD